MSRRTAREHAFKLLFQLEIQKEGREEQIQSFLEDNDIAEKDRDYILDIVEGTAERVGEIDKDISKYLKGWKINRISKVDLSVLRLAIYEILERNDIPENVSINEAVEIAKKYSGEESGAFVNGVLGRFVKARCVPGKANETE